MAELNFLIDEAVADGGKFAVAVVADYLEEKNNPRSLAKLLVGSRRMSVAFRGIGI